MHFQSRPHSAQQLNKLSEKACKVKAEQPVTIPESWRLSDQQRSFIDAMIDKKVSR
ncbi:hypothetical protein [Izhakiella australiensis]|uniref:hypothetical protein n=1 Tax=Izhakiella australiensis TaxID=1926881 RepID=UPI001592A337|nr:hypothetical protein [Izhakiella australiensis]